MPSNAFDTDALVRRLDGLADAKYRDFNAALIPGGALPSLGVRIPELRRLARELMKGDWRAFLDASRDYPLFELRMLHGMVLGGARCAIDEKLRLTDAFLPHVDNWAVCDGFVSSFKPSQADKAALFDFVCACADSASEYHKRFGLVMMMSYFREDPWADRVMAAYRGFAHGGYYARMGAAWGLATLFLYQRAAVLGILRDGVLDDFTHDKAIQKMCESHRVSDADKQMLRGLRRGRQPSARKEGT